MLIFVWLPLLALGLEVIPEVRALWLTDLFDLLVVLPTLAYIILADHYSLFSILRIGHTLSIASLLRSLSVLVTSLPDPRVGCERITGDFFTTIVFHRCGDCLFSGHALVLTVFGLYWFDYGHMAPRSLRWPLGLCIMAGLWAILANRAHYTVDVLVAIYTAAGLWWSHAYWWQSYAHQYSWFSSVRSPLRRKEKEMGPSWKAESCLQLTEIVLNENNKKLL